MKKLVFTSLLMILFAVAANAQVTVGKNVAPDDQAVLDLQAGDGTTKKGLLMPRVSLTSLSLEAPFSKPLTPGMSVYHTGPVAGVGGNDLAAGVYTWDGAKWISGGASEDAEEPWFYMPSILFDVSQEAVTSTASSPATINLYNKYKEQFNTVAAATAGFKSENAPELPAAISIPGAASDFYYYIIGYDKDTFEISSLDDAGNLTYKVKAVGTEKTFINILFVRK